MHGFKREIGSCKRKNPCDIFPVSILRKTYEQARNDSGFGQEVSAVWDRASKMKPGDGTRALKAQGRDFLLHLGNVGLDPSEVIVRTAGIGLVQETIQPPKFVVDLGQDVLAPEVRRSLYQIGCIAKAFRQGH